MIWAPARIAPSIDHLLLLDQPAARIPSTPTEPIPSTKTRPTLKCTAWIPGENGTNASATKVAAKQSSGARWKMKWSASSGVMFSLLSSFRPSASVCSRPCGPTRIGPSRCWTCAATLRSIQTSASAMPEMNPPRIAATSAIFARSTSGPAPSRPVSQAVTAGGIFSVRQIQWSITPPSPVDAGDHDVERREHRDDVGDAAALGDLGERGEVREVRAADLQPPGLRGAVADEEEGHLAAGGL